MYGGNGLWLFSHDGQPLYDLEARGSCGARGVDVSPEGGWLELACGVLVVTQRAAEKCERYQVPICRRESCCKFER